MEAASCQRSPGNVINRLAMAFLQLGYQLKLSVSLPKDLQERVFHFILLFVANLQINCAAPYYEHWKFVKGGVPRNAVAACLVGLELRNALP